MAVADITPIPLGLVDSNMDAAAAAFGDAFGRTGFAVVADHGVPDAVVDRALAATKALFALPDSVKARYIVAGGGGQRGLTPFGIETAKGAVLSDLKEFWHIGRDLPPGSPLRQAMPDNFWPEVPDFRPAVTALYAALDAAGTRVLRALARHLGLADDYFVDPTRDGNSILRLLHYPPVSGIPAAVRAGAHEDINVITLLLGAEEPGLQLLGRDGEWRDVDAPAGDTGLQYWRHARAPDRRAAAIDVASGGQSIAQAGAAGALFDALLPALSPRFRHRPDGEPFRRGASTDHRRCVPAPASR